MTKYSYQNNATKFILSALAIGTYCYFLFWLTGLAFEATTDLLPISLSITAFYFEPIALFITVSILAILTRRILLALFLTTGFYLILMLINAEMMRVFGLTFSPGDIKYSLQVFLTPEVWFSYWQQLLLLLSIIIIFFVYLFNTKPNNFLQQHKYKLLPVLILSFVLITIFHNNIAIKLKQHFQIWGDVAPINLPQHHGFLFAFYYQLLKHRSVEQPENYSSQTIANIISKYSTKNSTIKSTNPDVIIFLIEAFADPRQMAIETNYDAIPNFRHYAAQSLSGFALSPELGGQSANPEFELLTGMTMRYVPNKSIPYIDYITKPFPSLAREFNANGYTSHAIHVASLDYFNYKKAYRFLGFDHFYTLSDQKSIEKDVANRYPSENALVDEIIRVTRSHNTPQFIFSFPNSTHGFWDYPDYLNSDLNVVDPNNADKNHSLKTYLNALHTADKAIGRLIQHYDKSSKPTIIVVLGDHQPGLPEFRYNLRYTFRNEPGKQLTTQSKNQLKTHFKNQLHESYLTGSLGLLNDNDLNSISRKQARFRVPYLIWSNTDKNTTLNNTSFNLLASLIIKKAQINTSPLFNLTNKIRKQFGEFGKHTQTNIQSDLITDYQLLQYDIIFGQQYFLNHNEW